MKVAGHRPIIFFDGYCNLCNGSVQFLLRHNSSDDLLFASLQSSVAGEILGTHEQGADPSTVVLLLNGQQYDKSDAVVRIANYLKWPWKALSYGRYVPKVIRDAIYDLVARNRMSWFGRSEECMLPTPELRSRFLDIDERQTLSVQPGNV